MSTILIIDDHQMFAESPIRLLEDDHDLEVVGTAASCADAETAIQRHRPAVVVMDNVLPDGDGVELAARLRRRHPGMQFVMLSGQADPALLGRAGWTVDGTAAPLTATHRTGSHRQPRPTRL